MSPFDLVILLALVGWAIYKQTRVWVEADGRVLRQGTRVTVALFVGLVATKFALGTLANFWHVNDGAGLGEVLVMIAVMIAVEAELVARRAAALRASTPTSPVEPAAAPAQR